MTEQEKLEKDIESVLKDNSNCPEYCFTHRRPWACEPCQVKRVTDYCIRKEKEVQKKTARRYSSAITDTIMKYLGVTSVSEASKLSLIDSTITYDVVLSTIEKLNKRFDVEVEK